MSLSEIKTRLATEAMGRPWWRGAGIGLAEDKRPVVLLSVSQGHRAEAETLVAELGLSAEVRVRELGKVRAR